MFLEIRNLKKTFKDNTAVNDLSFSVNKGELACILGPSGCGKTTTLRVIGGFLTPDEGKVIIDEEDVTNLPPEKRATSTVFQSYALFPHMTVIQNVIYGLKFQGCSKKETLRKGEEYLELVGLEKEKNKKVPELSGGQQQRVALARSLIINPKVLLLDEPLSNLDAKLRIKMRNEIKSIQNHFNITMVFVTHDQEEALSIADKVLIMNEGKLEQIGTPEEVYNNPKSKFVLDFIGFSNVFIDNKGNTSFVRPEGVIIDRQRGNIEGVVEKINFLGSIIEYRVKTKQGIYKVHATNNGINKFLLNEKVHISFIERNIL